MKNISEKDFTARFKEHLIRANFQLRDDILDYLTALKKDTEDSSQQEIVDIFIENACLSKNENRGICQDTGYVQVYINIGNQVTFDFNIESAVNKAVSEVYEEKYLRKSIAHPVTRINTKTNTPAFFNYTLTEGDDFEVTILLKGGGSENVTRAETLLPTASQSEIEDWAVDVVRKAGAKACPPYLIGVGIGGTLEKAVGISKKNLLCRLDENPMDELESEMSANILRKINDLPIGFQGLRFAKTALSVVSTCVPCHIATLPMAVSIGCVAVRQSSFSL